MSTGLFIPRRHAEQGLHRGLTRYTVSPMLLEEVNGAVKPVILTVNRV